LDSTSFLFSFDAPARSVLYTLSLHDALPISVIPGKPERRNPMSLSKPMLGLVTGGTLGLLDGLSGFLEPSLAPVMTSVITFSMRSEEHTSELQSLRHLVCRLLLEKKKIK